MKIHVQSLHKNRLFAGWDIIVSEQKKGQENKFLLQKIVLV